MDTTLKLHDVSIPLPPSDPVWKVARYTSAAPIYFTECDNYVDGGVLANNPTASGLTEIQDYLDTHARGTKIACVVSVGCGVFPPKVRGRGGREWPISSETITCDARDVIWRGV